MLDDTLDYTFGLSTGLEYNPGLNADTAELRALAKIVGANDRLIMSHMRNEDDDQLETSIADLMGSPSVGLAGKDEQNLVLAALQHIDFTGDREAAVRKLVADMIGHLSKEARQRQVLGCPAAMASWNLLNRE